MTNLSKKLRHTAEASLMVFINDGVGRPKLLISIFFNVLLSCVFLFVIFGGQTDRPSDHKTDLGI